LRIAGLATGAAGVVAIGVGATYGLKALKIANEVEDRFSMAREAEGKRANKIAIACYISGGVLVGAGATLYWLGYRRDHREQALTIAPVVSAELTGIVVAGSFR
jgi:hypothetical protein